MSNKKAGKLADEDWEILLDQIQSGDCTPFLGAGASSHVLPLGKQIARQWAKKYGFPLADSEGNLPRVAQFMAIKKFAMFPKQQILKHIAAAQPPDFNNPDEPHRVLAQLPLPVYLTTNYDNFMVQALKGYNRDARQELCRWNPMVKAVKSCFDPPSSFQPTAANPVVFHLHGHAGVAQSLVLTEDDYLEFLACISREPRLLPPRIQEAWMGASLLFLGYRLTDWSFRVLFHNTVGQLGRNLGLRHVSVQLAPGYGRLPEERLLEVRDYLDHYFGELNIRVFWGTCLEFTAELRKRWEKRQSQTVTASSPMSAHDHLKSESKAYSSGGNGKPTTSSP